MKNDKKPYVIGYAPDMDVFFITKRNTTYPVLRKIHGTENLVFSFLCVHVEDFIKVRNEYQFGKKNKTDYILLDKGDGSLIKIDLENKWYYRELWEEYKNRLC